MASSNAQYFNIPTFSRADSVSSDSRGWSDTPHCSISSPKKLVFGTAFPAATDTVCVPVATRVPSLPIGSVLPDQLAAR
ncbi:unnamed protein product [Brassica rapa]|uniref:Uncharacterized protein n=1 Tax=Brassica campestris TaxID=3711 RepID=A0A3P6CQY9_BRACM|nr:unnamed protein product [Brassica rapa]VDD18106.1 unnamed protein product [Brassica rapa]